ncbi:MAG: tagaturonate epimerase family protein [Victivallaceae bacterium]|nr:tagaturonate epimerase family protein [Victivallaceae bacterium]
MKKLIKSISDVIDSHENEIRENIKASDSSLSFYKNSIHKIDNVIVAMFRDHKNRFLMVFSNREDGIIAEFSGEQIGDSDTIARKCSLDEHNAKVLRKHFPWTAPVSLRDRKTTIGCGDRLGLAAAGHIAAVKNFEVTPVLAQQSIRELDLTGRTYRQVVDDATFMVFQCGYKDGYGADGDHLKTIEDIDVALAADMPMITLDLSEVMNAAAGDWEQDKIDKAYAKLPPAARKRIEADYAGRKFSFGKSIIDFDAPTARRCAVMYLDALDFADKVHRHLVSRRGAKFDLEISIDETTSPTLPAHHLFIARELVCREVEFTSLAPRFIGEFQKAIDYIGDPEEFDRQFRVHADIARNNGDYKVSIHSGSDKFTVYPTIGEMTGMRLHVKTAGTSWLEAVTVIAENDPVLYRVMHKCALDNFNKMLALYHITADITKIPDVDELCDEDLPGLMEMAEARQLLHITYGPILNDRTIRPLFFEAMHKFEKEYLERLKVHFTKHLTLLGVPPKKNK